MGFKFGYVSCLGRKSPNPVFKRIQEHAPKFTMIQGDAPYLSGAAGKSFGVQWAAISKTSTATQIGKQHQAKRAESYFADFISWAGQNGSKLWYMPDDHEWAGDDFDHTITQANDGICPLGAVTQADVNYHFNQGMLAAKVYMQDNPVNTDSEAVIGDIPSEALVGDTPPASNYPINYFRYSVDQEGNYTTVNPFIEFFCLDTITYRSPIGAIDNASKTALGATQKAWLKKYVKDSTAPIRIILCNKKLHAHSVADNFDTWGRYVTEREEILAYFTAQGVPYTIWVVGDTHTPSVTRTSVAGGDTANTLCICTSPGGMMQRSDAGQMTMGVDKHVWKLFSAYKSAVVYGLGIVENGVLTLQIREIYADKVMWSVSFNSAGEVVTPRLPITF